MTFLTAEQLGSSEAVLSDRVDAYCVNEKGGLNYNLKAVYVIGILNFILDNSHDHYFSQEVELMDAHCDGVFYDKIT